MDVPLITGCRYVIPVVNPSGLSFQLYSFGIVAEVVIDKDGE